MSSNVKSGFVLDRSLSHRVLHYLDSNIHKKFISVNEMAEVLQKQYPEYRREKRIPFINSVNQVYQEIKKENRKTVIDLCDSNSEIDSSKTSEAPEELPPALHVASQKKAVKRKKAEVEEGNIAGTFQSYIPKKKFSEIGGCESLFKELPKLVMHMIHPELPEYFGTTPPRGLLFCGPSGCGKTLLALAIAGELGIPIFKVVGTELVSGVSGGSEEQLRKLFHQALANAPCVIFIDEIDAIAPKRETAQREMEKRIVTQLLSCLDDLDNNTAPSSVLVIGATNRPGSLDPALRRAGRFDRELFLGIPDVEEREEILQLACQGKRIDETLDWKLLASNTPGYVGADLHALASEAGLIAQMRAVVKLEISPGSQKERTDKSYLSRLREQGRFEDEQLAGGSITMDDFNAAMKLVQPSALREGFATVPSVTWDDVGALRHARKKLNSSILLPIRHKSLCEAFGLGAPSGVLLCGPPGCGKTLLAKAMANEGGINFMSVKGPELLNMYVGESEHAVRQVFQRARNAVPCVIFFDELDALCPVRSGCANEGGATRVVNQLLTEMDGIESRHGVFLMAATNRPDIIDPAVLRPGRLDKIIHVGFPTAEDRVDILRALTKNGTNPVLAPDVSLVDIGSDPRLEGYTGADLHALVHESTTNAIEEFLHSHNVSADSKTARVHLRHFQAAIGEIKPSVSVKDREHYINLASA